MSDDLIRRSDAIEAIELVDWYHQNRNKDMVSGANSDEHQAWYKADDIYEALEAVPSADRPQGEWIRIEWNESIEGYIIPMRDYKCSACGEKKAVSTRFCPICGAKMKGADDE